MLVAKEMEKCADITNYQGGCEESIPNKQTGQCCSL